MATTKQVEVAAPYAGERQTFRLASPIALASGKELAELTLAEPRLQHYIVMGRIPSPTGQLTSIVSQLSGVPEEACAKLKLRDVGRMRKWIDGFVKDVKAVPDADGKAAEPSPDATCEFELLAPVPTDGKPIERMTLREPDVATGVAVEKFKTEHEQTAAMIATLTGHTIPIVSRLLMRDVKRMEAWLDPFVAGSASTGAGGGT